ALEPLAAPVVVYLDGGPRLGALLTRRPTNVEGSGGIMSSNDPLPPPSPGDVPPPLPAVPPPPAEAVMPGLPEAQGYQETPPVPAPPYGAVMPEWYARGLRLPPPLPPPGAPLFPWPHPNFWWSILWCIG